MYRISSLLILFFMSTMVSGQTSNPQQYKYVFTVAKDGTGEYQSIQDAIDAMRVYPLSPITLYIKNGVYNEKIELPANNTDVTFIGENVDSTVISWNDYSGKGKHTTFTSYTAKISGNRFRAENITFSNTAGPVGQALALYVDADKAVFRNCKFLGYQDTIFTSGEQSNQLFDHCYIEGTTDFIFGAATVWCEQCKIHSKKNSHVTAASTPADKNYGYVFNKCVLTGDTSLHNVSLGRPWRPFAAVVYMYCTIGAHIKPEGWSNWNNTDNFKTTRFAEYENRGPGAAITGRISWSKQLSAEEIKMYTRKKVFKDWDPVK